MLKRRWPGLVVSLSLGLGPAVGATVVEGDVRAAAPGAAMPEGARAELVSLPENVASNRLLLAGHASPEPVARAPLTDLGGGVGRFRLAAPEPGVYAVHVDVPGHVPMRHAPLALVEATELPPVTLARDAGTRVVVTGTAGEPLAGVWVLARSEASTPAPPLWRAQAANGWTAAPRLGRSGADGTLRLARRQDERLEVDVFFPGSARRQRLRGAEELRVRLAPDASGRDLHLRGAGAGVAVALGEPPWPAGITDADGRLRVRGRFSEPTVVRWMGADGWLHHTVLEPGEGPAVFDVPTPRRFRGRLVAGGDGRPLAGALLWPLWDPGAFVVTDAGGEYELSVPEVSGFTVQGEAAGFVPQSLKLTPGALATGHAPELALAPASSLGGRAVDAAGRPLAGVHVVARAMDYVVRPAFLRRDRAEARATTDAAGRFRLPRLSGDTIYSLAAVKEGFFTDSRRVGGLRPGRDRDDLRFVLVANRAAFGRVLDLGERPLAEVEVRLAESSDPVRPDRVVTVTTDATGRFEIAAFPAPQVDLTASKDGFAALVVPALEVTPGAGAMDLGTLLLEPGATVTGRVVDGAGEALADAAVWIVEDGVADVDGTFERVSRRSTPDTYSEGDGTFRITDFRSGERIDLVVHLDGYLPAAVEQLEASAGGKVEVVLEAAARVGGRLVDEAGRPIAGAEVTITGLGTDEGTMPVPRRSAAASAWTVTDDGGFFDLTGLADGDYDVEARAEGFQPSAPRRVRLEAGVPSSDLLIRLAEGAVVEGRVLDADGDGVAGVRVNAGASRATSERDGSYRLTGVVPGRRLVEAWHPGFNPLRREVEVEAGANVLDLTFDPAHGLDGRVVDTAGTPVADVLVVLTLENGHPHPHRTLSDDQGRFGFPRLGEGRYLLEAERQGYALLDPEPRVDLRDERDDVEVVMTPSATLGGEVLGLDLADLAGVELWAANDDGRTRQSERVRYDGRYEINDLAPGDYLVSASADGGTRRAEGRIVLDPGGRHVLDLVFDEGLVLSGRVFHGGEPVDAATLEVMGFDVTARRQVRTDHEGRFRMEGLEPGSYRLSVVSHRDMLIYNEDLDLAGDRDLQIDLATGGVGGRVVDAAGEGVAQAIVSLRKVVGDDREGSLFALGSDADGFFRFERLTAGRYRLSVRKDGYAVAEDLLEVTSGSVPEGLRYVLERTSGLELGVRLSSGAVPPVARLTLLDASGRQVLHEARALDASGRALFPTVPPGRWEIVVAAAGAAARRLTVEVPGEPVELVLADAGRLRVRVRSLLDSVRTASLRLVEPAGKPLQGMDVYGTPVSEWPLSHGTSTVDGVPAGLWTLEVTGAQGLVFTAVVETAGAAQMQVDLD